MNAVTALVTLRATQRLSKRDGRLEWIGYIVIDGWGVAIAIVFSLTDYYYCKRWWPCFSFLFLFVFSFIYFLLFESFLLLLRARLHWPVDSEKLMTGRLGRILYTHCRATGCSCWTRPAACSSGRSKEHFPVLDSPLSPLSLSLSLSVLSLRLHMVIESRHYSPICIAVSTECGGQSSITFEKFHPRLAANFLERSQIFI